jgi:CRISPR-associated protein Csx17
VTYSRLLGTGGNFGRLDLQSTYLQRALTVLADPKAGRSSAGWLRAALYGEETAPYLRDAVGQFDPGRAGGIQSSPAEKADADGFANPWAFLLTIEGALLFASAATRRQGADSSDAAIPFVVRSSPVGSGSSAAGENALAEIWTPEWDRPATLAEIEHLLGEGRAQWRDRPARNGLDFVRAVATLGVDRGIRRFTRSVFAERHGQSPLAVPLGVVEVAERGGAGLLGQFDPWLEGLRRISPLPQAVQAGLRGLDEALYAAAAAGGPDAFRRIVVALGRLHQAVSRSGRTVERVRALGRQDGAAWWQVIRPTRAGEPGAAELRVAAALAGGRDIQPGDISRRDGPPGGRRADWLLRGLLAPAVGGSPVATGGSMIDAVAAAHRARALPGRVRDPGEDAEHAGWPVPAVQGVFSAFARGPRTGLADVVDLLTGAAFDDGMFADYLRGLLLLDLSMLDEPLAAGIPLPALMPPALSLLLPFYAAGPLLLPLDEEDPTPRPVLLRPGADWLPRLHALDIRGVAADAAERLRVAGVRALADPAWAAAGVDADRLAAALLVPVPPGQRVAALRRVATFPSIPDSHEIPDPQGASA